MRHARRRGLAAAGGVMVAMAVAAVAAGGLTGVERLWPVLLGAALGFAPGPVAGRLVAFVLGVVAAWVGVVLRLALLPDTAAGRALAGALVLAAVVAVAVASRDRMPLWAALVGAAGFLALADAALAVDPLGFTVDRAGALGSLLLGSGLGAAAAVGARTFWRTGLRPRDDAAASTHRSRGEP